MAAGSRKQLQKLEECRSLFCSMMELNCLKLGSLWIFLFNFFALQSESSSSISLKSTCFYSFEDRVSSTGVQSIRKLMDGDSLLMGLKLLDSDIILSYSAWKEYGLCESLSCSRLSSGLPIWFFVELFLCSCYCWTISLIVGLDSTFVSGFSGDCSSSLFLCSVGVRLGKGLPCFISSSAHSVAILGELIRNSHLTDLRLSSSSILIKMVRLRSLALTLLISLSATFLRIFLATQLEARFLELKSVTQPRYFSSTSTSNLSLYLMPLSEFFSTREQYMRSPLLDTFTAMLSLMTQLIIIAGTIQQYENANWIYHSLMYCETLTSSAKWADPSPSSIFYSWGLF